LALTMTSRSEISVSAPNSLLLVTTSDQPEIPASMDARLIASTSTTVAVGTLSESEGETVVRLTDETPDQESDGVQLVYEGRLEGGLGFVRVINVRGEAYLEWGDVPESFQLRIWANDPSEPDLVVVEIRRNELS
jgi:hypothetical protein